MLVEHFVFFKSLKEFSFEISLIGWQGLTFIAYLLGVDTGNRKKNVFDYDVPHFTKS